MTEVEIEKKLERLGFRYGQGSVHTARTMMLNELSSLLDFMGNSGHIGKNDYLAAIIDDNCLGKPSGNTRKLTAYHLKTLYILDPSFLVFKALRYFWHRDKTGRPLLALLCAYARDALLRSSFAFIYSKRRGELVYREELEAVIDSVVSKRFSKATLTSTVQNINSTWKQSRHLEGKLKKYRSKATATPGSAAYAALLGYIGGERGMSLFETPYARLLDCSPLRAVELTEMAARRGWMVVNRIADVIEVSFPGLITGQEMEWMREQY